jgi:hypothetical protein
MAIAIGTTARQLAALGRWVLAGVLVTGMLCWWSCGYYNWAAIMGSLSLSFVIFLTLRIVTGQAGFLGNGIYIAIFGPAVILAVHVAATGLGTAKMEYHALAGSLNMSMLTQWVLLGLGVLVMQNIFVSDADNTRQSGNADNAARPRTKMQVGLPIVCGIGMILGSILASLSGKAKPIADGLALIGYAGIAVMITPLWTHNHQADAQRVTKIAGLKLAKTWNLGYLLPRLALLSVGGWALVALAIICPRFATLQACCICSGVMLLAGLLFSGMRIRLFLFAAISAGLAVGMYLLGLAKFPSSFNPSADVVGYFGAGEQAFALRGLWGGSTGLAVLSSSTGLAGTLWLVLVLALAWVVQFIHARRAAPARQLGIVAWLFATVLATVAMLSAGGLFIPVFTLAAAFTWALMPSMLGLASPRRRGVSLLVVMVCMVILLGLARQEGLLGWAVLEMGGGDEIMHAGVSFLAGLVLAWHMGIKKYWMGLVGIAIIAVAGGLGEVAQKIASTRQMEFKDWFFDCVGCGVAILVYLPAIACNLCESADARPADEPGKYNQYGQL